MAMQIPVHGSLIPPRQVQPTQPPVLPGTAPAATTTTPYSRTLANRAPTSYAPLQSAFPQTASPVAGRDYNELVSNSLEYFMDPNSDLMQQAEQRGLNLAAQRGGINSSIAAGNAQREVLDAAGNLAQGAVQAQLGQEQVQLQGWLDTNNFNRELSAMPYQNSMNMLNFVSQASVNDPQLYTPDVVSGFSNFYNQQMNDILRQYFQ